MNNNENIKNGRIKNIKILPEYRIYKFTENKTIPEKTNESVVERSNADTNADISEDTDKNNANSTVSFTLKTETDQKLINEIKKLENEIKRLAREVEMFKNIFEYNKLSLEAMIKKEISKISLK